MVRLPVLSGKEVCEILEAHGFSEVRQRGSHCIMQRKTVDGTVSVTVPLHAEVRRGTLASIIRQSGLAKDVFEAR